MRELRCWWGVI